MVFFRVDNVFSFNQFGIEMKISGGGGVMHSIHSLLLSYRKEFHCSNVQGQVYLKTEPKSKPTLNSCHFLTFLAYKAIVVG